MPHGPSNAASNSVFELAFYPVSWERSSACKLARRVLNHEQAAIEPKAYSAILNMDYFRD